MADEREEEIRRMLQEWPALTGWQNLAIHDLLASLSVYRKEIEWLKVCILRHHGSHPHEH